MPVNTFSAWKKIILDKAKSTIEPLSVHPSTKDFNNIKNSQDLNEIHNRFVIVPGDKASNNIGIVCKFFYIQKLILEINNSGNFQVSPISKDAIINNYFSMLKSKHNITNTLPRLPYLFWIPKFHKTPVDFRYITSGRHTVSNVLSKQVSVCLKHLLNIERTNCKFLHKFDNIKKTLYNS